MKDWLINHISDKMFTWLVNAKGHAHISKAPNGWLIQKDQISLLSPTPKFLGFGLSAFTEKFERYFKIRQSDACLDVGACIGDTAIPMVKKAGRDGVVFAVEPDPTNLKYLTLNVAKYKNVRVVPLALSNVRGTVKFNLHKTVTGHSLVADRMRPKTVEVIADTLDTLFGQVWIDFAKIDVQSAEAQVLEGGNEFLKHVPKLVVETHARDDPERRTYPKVMDILEKYDFKGVRFCMDNGCVYAWR